MMLRCTGCGSTDSMDEIRRKHPIAISCCPERRMEPIGAAERIERVLGGLPNAQPAAIDLLLEIVRDERVDECRECAAVADSMDGVQNIGDRIRERHKIERRSR